MSEDWVVGLKKESDSFIQSHIRGTMTHDLVFAKSLDEYLWKAAKAFPPNFEISVSEHKNFYKTVFRRKKKVLR